MELTEDIRKKINEYKEICRNAKPCDALTPFEIQALENIRTNQLVQNRESIDISIGNNLFTETINRDCRDARREAQRYFPQIGDELYDKLNEEDKDEIRKHVRRISIIDRDYKNCINVNRQRRIIRETIDKPYSPKPDVRSSPRNTVIVTGTTGLPGFSTSLQQFDQYQSIGKSKFSPLQSEDDIEGEITLSPLNPEISKPATLKPAISKPATSKPEVSKPEVSKPEASKPEVSKPAISKPAISKPGVSKPDKKGKRKEEIIVTTGLTVGEVEQFMKYAGNGNLKKLQTMANDISDVDIVDESGNTALFYATMNNHRNVIEYLLEKGANPNYVNNEMTPLFIAVEKNLPKIVELFKTYKGDINLLNENHETKLMSVLKELSREKNKENIEMLTNFALNLIKFGIDPNIRDENDYAAICYAASDSPKIMERLLELKTIDLTNLIDNGCKLLFYAIGKNDLMTTGTSVTHEARAGPDSHQPLRSADLQRLKLINMLVKRGVEIHSKINPNNDAFIYVINNRLKDIFNILINSDKLDINFRDSNGTTPLMYAAKYYPEAIIPLLDKGADLFHIDNKGYEAYDYAKDDIKPLFDTEYYYHFLKSSIKYGNINNLIGDTNVKFRPTFLTYEINKDKKYIPLLLENGADPNLPDETNITPLNKAIESKQPDTVELLLKYMADPNKASDDFTPLYRAIFSKQFDIVELLLKYDADPNQISQGLTPLYLAIKLNQPNIVELLLQHQASPDKIIANHTPLNMAIRLSNPNIIELLLKYNADPNKMAQDFTPIYTAILMDNEDIVELLLKYKADSNKISRNLTPLLKAISNENLNIIRLLIENGADVNYFIEPNKTPLSYAINTQNMSIIKMLIENGADPNQEIGEYDSLLFAANKENPEILGYLLESGANLDRLYDTRTVKTIIENHRYKNPLKGLQIIHILQELDNKYYKQRQMVSEKIQELEEITDEFDELLKKKIPKDVEDTIDDIYQTYSSINNRYIPADELDNIIDTLDIAIYNGNKLIEMIL